MISIWFLNIWVWKIQFDKLDFFSSLNFNFAGYTGSKNPVHWTGFQNLIFQNQVEINRGLGFSTILHQNLLYPIILFFSTAFFYFSSNHWQFDMLFWKWHDRINVRATFEKCRSNSNWSWTYFSHTWRSVYGHYTYSRLCKSLLHFKNSVFLHIRPSLE